MTNLNDYPWISATARMGISDIMWEYSIDIDGAALDIPMYKMLEYRHPTTNYPLLRCLPVSREINHDYPSIVTTITGYSNALYLRNPIHIMERQSKITLDDAGNVSEYENPKTYLNRIWAMNDNGMDLVFQDIPSANLLKKQYTYDANPIVDLVSEIASDYDLVYFEQIKFINSKPIHKFYIVDFDDIDTRLDLPAQITIYSGDSCIKGSPGPKIEMDLTDSYNTVWVELCRKKDNAWFFAEAKTASVTAKTELPRVMVYRSTSLLTDPVGSVFLDSAGHAVKASSSNCGCVTSIPNYPTQSGGVSFGTPAENARDQAIADTKATALLGFLDLDVKRYEIELQLTKPEYYSLALYQKIKFSGFSDIPTELMRITNIEYNFQNAGDGGDIVRLTVAPASEITVARKFEEMQDDIRANQTALKRSIERGIVNNKLGIVKSISTGQVYANIQLRSSGRMVQTRAWGERQL